MAGRRVIQIVTGPSGSDRASRIDDLLREAGDRARLLVPSRMQARQRRERLLSVPGCPGAWGMPVWSLTDFAYALLDREGVVVSRLESTYQRTLIMARCLEALRKTMPATRLADIEPTPGLLRHLIAAINAIKQAAIEPEEFATRIASATWQSPLDEGVAALYRLYQEALLASNLYDVAGLYWRADLVARASRPRLLEGVDTLLLDGFDDFTPSEFRLLESLLGHVSHGTIGLNLDSAPDRQDRYALPLNTLRQLQERFDSEVVVCAAPEPRSYAEFAARHAFWRDEPRLPEGLRANLAIVPCSDAIHEIETIARRIKRLIVDEGATPGDIAVIYWSVEGVAAAVRGTFDRFGLPCQIQEDRPLSQTATGRAILGITPGLGEWAREAVIELLMAPCLRGLLWAETEGVGDTAGAVPFYFRRAQALRGYDDTVFRLTRLREQARRNESQDARTLLHRRPDAVAEIDAVLCALERLRALPERLPSEGSALAHAAAIDGLIDAFSIPAEAAPLEAAAAAGIRALLELLADEGGDAPCSREEFCARFARGMEELTCAAPGEPGGVNVLHADGARNRRFAHVFVAGLMEGQAPSAPAINAVYPEHDRERLLAVGIPLETNQDHHARQRMLFGHVLECAVHTLTLSWPLAQDSGRESGPSPFLTDVRELFPESAGVVAPYPRADSFLPESEDIASAHDASCRALYDTPALAPAFADECAPCQVGAAVEAERHSEADFGAYDAVLRDAELVGAIAKHYGVQHEFSVAQLETYLSCPFSFYTQRILHLDDTEPPDGSVTPLEHGSLLHDVLERFHGRFAGRHIRDIGLAEALAAMDEALEESFTPERWSASAAPRAAVAAEKCYARACLRRYIRAEYALEEEAAWKPMYFETAFGRACRGEAPPPNTRASFVMETAAGPVRFTGKIDRIDCDGDRARIIDYKSGLPPAAKDIVEGNNIQLSVYAEAVENLLLPDHACVEARYLAVGRNKRQEALGVDRSDRGWPDRKANMDAAISSAVTNIREGYFPPIRAGKTCYGCGHARACRHEEARIARKLGVAPPDEEEAFDS